MDKTTPEAGEPTPGPISPQQRVLLAVSRIRTGELPSSISGPVYAGNGAGERCALCLLVVTPAEVAYELVPESAGVPQPPYQLHLACFEAWALACRPDRDRADET